MDAQTNLVARATVTCDATSDGQRHDTNDADATSQVAKTLLGGTNDAHPSSKAAAPRSQSCSKLENLPPELRHRLLSSIPDLQSLRSLVHASPILHAQYQHSRDRILRTCIGRELDGFLIDAYATHMSRPHELGSPRTNEKITKFTDTYSNWLFTPESSPDLNSIDPGRLRSISEFHLSVAQPLAHRYCEWAFGNLIPAILDFVADETESEPTAEALGIDDLSPQRSELIRVFRAIYRYETYYNLFGRNEGKREGALREGWTNHRFLYRFEPWEAEAVGCIHVFINQEYREILKRLKDDLYPPNVRFRLEGGVYRYEEAFRLSAEVNDYLESMISRGVRIAVQLLATHDDEELIAKVRQCLFRGEGQDSTLGDALSTTAQIDRLYELDAPLDEKDEAARNRDRMEFTGDAVPPTGPPSAWVQLWASGYSNVYGEYAPESVQQWGYVMWDKERWNFAGGDSIVEEQWRYAPDRAEQIEMDYSWRPR